jgi:hypothetical protein
MRVFVAVLVLIFSLQSWTKADDIRDFQIEGMSIGDSLLDFISESKIKSLFKTYYPNSKKYVRYYEVLDSNIYDAIDVYVLDSDKKFIIHSLSGIIEYHDDIENCYPKKKDIIKEINESIDLKPLNYISDYPNDTSKSDVTDFDLSNGSIRVFCTDYSKQREDENYGDFLSVTASTKEIIDWLEIAH